MAQEKSFENKLKRYLESLGCYNFGTPKHQMKEPIIGYYEKRWGGGQFSKSGLPDIHMVLHNCSVELELKAPNGVPSAIQLKNLSMITEAGCLGYVLVEKATSVIKIKNYILEHYPEYSNVEVIDFENLKVIIKNILTA